MVMLGLAGSRAELGAEGKGEKDEKKAFQVACGVPGEEAGFVGGHVGYQAAAVLQVGDI